MSHTLDGNWTGNPDRKRVWEETERARETRERYARSPERILTRLRYNHKRRLEAIEHGSRTPREV